METTIPALVTYIVLIRPNCFISDYPGIVSKEENKEVRTDGMGCMSLPLNRTMKGLVNRHYSFN